VGSFPQSDDFVLDRSDLLVGFLGCEIDSVGNLGNDVFGLG